MPSFPTTYFGELEYNSDSVCEFPSGLPGFEEHTRFLLVEQPQTHPLVFVQSLEGPDLCFIAVPVSAVDPEYKLDPTEEDIGALQLTVCQPRIGEDVACLALMTLEENVAPTANLRSPLVINLKKRIGLQIIHPDSRYSFRHPILCRPEMAQC
jgi:flagellar assembly factor FliW